MRRPQGQSPPNSGSPATGPHVHPQRATGGLRTISLAPHVGSLPRTDDVPTSLPGSPSQILDAHQRLATPTPSPNHCDRRREVVLCEGPAVPPSQVFWLLSTRRV